MSALPVTREAKPSFRSRCVPELAALVTGPDTAPTARPSSAAGGNVQGTGAVTGLFRGDILAVAGGGAGTGDRHAITRRRGEEGDGASQPQHSRARAHIVECSRPLVLAGKRTRSPRRSVSDSACATVRGTMRGAALRRHSPASTASTVFGTPPVTAASRTVSTAPNTATSPPVTASSAPQSQPGGDPRGAFIPAKRSDRHHSQPPSCVAGRCASSAQTRALPLLPGTTGKSYPGGEADSSLIWRPSRTGPSGHSPRTVSSPDRAARGQRHDPTALDPQHASPPLPASLHAH